MDQQAIDIRKVKIQHRIRALRAAGWTEENDPMHEGICALLGQWFPEESLLKGLTEAGEARRVMVDSFFGGRFHFEDEYAWLGANGEPVSTCASRGCTPADDTEETRAWVARQGKDSHAGG